MGHSSLSAYAPGSHLHVECWNALFSEGNNAQRWGSIQDARMQSIDLDRANNACNPVCNERATDTTVINELARLTATRSSVPLFTAHAGIIHRVRVAN